jgi:signal transduction histidine kinase
VSGPPDPTTASLPGVPLAPSDSLRGQLSRLTFRTKLALISTSICLICMVAAGIATAVHQHSAVEKVLRQRAQTLAAVVAANSEAAVSFEDAGAARLLLSNLAADPAVEAAQLLRISLEGSQALLASFSRDQGPPQAPPVIDPDTPLRIGDRLHLLSPVTQGGEVLGHLYLQVQMPELEALRLQLLQVAALVVSVVVVLAWMLSRQLQGVVTRPVTELLSTTDAVRRSKDYALRARVFGEDELGQLTRAVNAMLAEVQAHDLARAQVERDVRDLNEQLESKVRVRTQDLQASNLDLQEAIESLRRTQHQLVESEKLAALGGLVAGVAHEINTPLGICVTVASHLGEAVSRLQGAYQQGIRRSDLERFLDDSRQAVDIINTNLNRAAELVRSFKQVAVDQGSEERRKLNAREYLGEVLTSLSPQLKRQRIAVELDCDAGIELDTYPGVLAQIVTNLAINASLHAFETQASPRIRLQGRQNETHFELRFEDNGCGMSSDVRSRIFEPFFTTRRGSGGSGLGLHIVYNQVTQQLGGEIRCASEPGQGSCFTLRMPVRTPEPHREPAGS